MYTNWECMKSTSAANAAAAAAAALASAERKTEKVVNQTGKRNATATREEEALSLSRYSADISLETGIIREEKKSAADTP